MAQRLNFVARCVALSCTLSLSCGQQPSPPEFKKNQGASRNALPEGVDAESAFDNSQVNPSVKPSPGQDTNPGEISKPDTSPVTSGPGGAPIPSTPNNPNNPTPIPTPVPPPNPGAGIVTRNGNPLIPAGRGASMPWTEFQAEDGKTNATVIGPSRARYDGNHIEAEAIGRKAVRLAKSGDYVAIVTGKAANSIVVRLSVPDAPSGGGKDYTIGVYINGKRMKSLQVTSRYSWVYGGEALTTPNDPSAGQPHAFFDEARALIENIPAGAEVKLQKDPEDNAEFYVIDLIDLEQVAMPLLMPANGISVTDYGATVDDASDDGVALQKAIDALQGINEKIAKAEDKKILWIPKGTLLVNSLPDPKALGLSIRGLAIQGAGMWYSTLKGKRTSMFCWGSGGCKFRDFSMLGETDRRNDSIPDSGFNGHVGADSVVENLWVEHYKVGMWVGGDKDQYGTNNLQVSNSRFRNLYADGINLNNGTSNSKITNVHFRNTGDDGVAIWSFKGAGNRVTDGNLISNVTVQAPWRAHCFSVYGGANAMIRDSVCEDPLTYPGMNFGTEFNAHPFSGTNVAKNMSLIRAGGTMFNKLFGALSFRALEGPLTNVRVENIDVIDSTFMGIHFEGGQINGVSLKGVNISGSGTFGIQATGGANGKVSMEGVVVKTSGTKPLEISGGTLDSFFDRLAGNSGW